MKLPSLHKDTVTFISAASPSACATPSPVALACSGHCSVNRKYLLNPTNPPGRQQMFQTQHCRALFPAKLPTGSCRKSSRHQGHPASSRPAKTPHSSPGQDHRILPQILQEVSDWHPSAESGQPTMRNELPLLTVFFVAVSRSAPCLEV